MEKLEQYPQVLLETENRHSDYYTHFLSLKEQQGKRGGYTQAMREITKEIGNVRLAWAWAAANIRQNNIARSLEALHAFFESTGWAQEGVQAFQDAIRGLTRSDDSEVSSPERRCLIACLMARQSTLCFRLSRFEQSRQLADNSLKIFRELDRFEESALPLNTLGLLELVTGKLDEAKTLFQESCLLAQESNQQKILASSFGNLGIVCNLLGQNEQAIDKYRQALTLYQEIGYLFGVANALNNIGIIAKNNKNYAEANDFFWRSFELGERLNNLQIQSNALGNLADSAFLFGYYPQAEELFKKQLLLCEEVGDRYAMAMTLGDLGEITQKLHQYAQAANYFLSAFDIALTIPALPVLLGKIVQSSGLLYEVGEAVEQIYAYLFYAISHPVVHDRVKRDGQTLFLDLASKLTPAHIAEIEATWANKEVEKVVRLVSVSLENILSA